MPKPLPSPPVPWPQPTADKVQIDRLLDLLTRAGGVLRDDHPTLARMKPHTVEHGIRRLEAILALAADGATARTVAVRARLSHQGMRNLIERWSRDPSLRSLIPDAYLGQGPTEQMKSDVRDRMAKRQASTAAAIEAADARRRERRT